MTAKSKRCPQCGGEMVRSAYCGVRVCEECDYHDGLERCYCGWSLTDPGHGRQELEEAGEEIDPD